ncbi:PAS domain S-box protein [Tahibacter amnicola]|uniref:histidine kinase n=1 Tax=Tahibacter amnicola TaxID=2976241 RepID=A0ABY6B9B3_9GAMM|nr:PAS domain S-box protein [Tahibacter amnicola]UXI66464.1 PAS domain S-box protein [Tahibacter amnicola]
MTTPTRPALFEALFETAPDAMIVVDRNGRIVLANPQAERLFGYAPGELDAQPIEILLPESARQAHRGHRERYASSPRVRPMGAGQELIGLRRDGSQFPTEIALSPLLVDGESLFAASVRDVSETQRARQALIRAGYDACVAQIGQLALEARDNAALLDSVPERVCQALKVSAVAILLVNRDQGEFVVQAEHGWTDTLPSNLSAAEFQPSTATPASTTALFAHAGYANAVSVPLFDRGQTMGTLVALNQEPRVFDRDAMHLLQSIANLIAAAVQRSRTEDQLSHAQRLDAIGQLTGGVAHDFNNLLTVVSGNLQLLEAELPENSPAQTTIGAALRAVDRGSALTRKLLAFARRQRLTPRSLAPQALLDELGVMLRRTLGEQIAVRITCDERVPNVHADPAELDAALVNLALNSRDAMPRGGRLDINVRKVAVTEPAHAGEAITPGDYVVFSVTDTGTGMTPETLSRALDPFFTTKEYGKGSGLGLSMVYGFAKQSGGHLSIDSQLGYGTHVDLYLPVHQGEARSQAITKLPIEGGRETVLVVEDEPLVLDVAVAFLRSLGYDVIVATDARGALEQLARSPAISMLFSDVILGDGMTGDELARTARQSRPDLPVLLTSGYERTPHRPDAGDTFDLLRKPYRREELAAALRRALDGA